MIYPNYVDQYGLVNAIHDAGHTLHKLDNDIIVDDLTAVQAIVAAYSPLPLSQNEAKEKIKAASVTKRLEYVTDAPGKDAEYKTKEAEAVQFEADATVGIYMQARATATSETAQQVADVWNAKSLLWRTVGASISSIEDKAVIDLDAETDWTNCVGIAQAAVAAIEAV